MINLESSTSTNHGWLLSLGNAREKAELLELELLTLTLAALELLTLTLTALEVVVALGDLLQARLLGT